MNKPTENNPAPTQTESQANTTIEKNTTEIETVSADNADVKAITFHSSSDFHEHLLNKKGSYFLVGGSYLTTKAAEIECQQWFLKGTPATVFKPVKSSFHRIVLGRFQTKEEVQAYSVTIDMIPGANLSMFRWDLR
jgi:cell division protein FtsN